MDIINNSGSLDRKYPVKDTLFFKIQGADEAVRAAAKTIQKTVKKHASEHFQFAASDEEAEKLWECRKYALVSVIGSIPGCKVWTTDVW